VIRDKGFLFVNTGVMIGSMTVQTIAIVSVSTMVLFPTPVIIDPVTGIRSHMVRWAEWIAAGFLMTFLTESVDMPVRSYDVRQSSSSSRQNSTGTKTPVVAWMHGIAIGVSTSAGLLTSLCTSWAAWLTIFTISWILFCSLFVRLYQRYKRLMNMSPGVAVEEKEDYDRAKYSLKTIAVCTVVWTALATSWSMIAFMKPTASPDSIFSSQSLVLVTESFFEALSKIWYADLLVEIHNIVFDDASRMMRRLETLRSLMSAVWDHSSDTLIWGSCAGLDSSVINGIISPKGRTFLGLGDNIKSTDAEKTGTTTLIEVDQDTYQYRSFNINLSSPISREEAMALRTSKLKSKKKPINPYLSSDRDKNLSVVAKLLCEAYTLDVKEEKIVIKELIRENEAASVHQCEAKMTKMESRSCLIILRDISERYQRFETEKKLVEEQTARRKDFEANRFTRHEVKNGILAAIGLVESLRDTAASRSTPSKGSAKENLDMSASDSSSVVRRDSITVSSTIPTTGVEGDGPVAEEFSLCDTSTGFEDGYGELDNTLRDILDTIMDHAMSLDVINEEYDLRKERVNVPEVLSNIRRQANCASGQSRFNLSISPESFPVLGLDPRLLRHIYQNALSNACRYGKAGGNIETYIRYDEKKKRFSMVRIVLSCVTLFFVHCVRTVDLISHLIHAY
jgi:signal transduction histidine kinase